MKKLFNIKSLHTQQSTVSDIIHHYHNHISIKKIRSLKYTHREKITFNLVSSNEINQKIYKIWAN